MQIDLKYKEDLLKFCVQQIEQKLVQLQVEIDAKKLDLKTATKSSAGDKHETARAMIHLEQEKLGIQFQEVQKNFRILSQINLCEHTSVKMGSLVQTDKAIFFIGVALGKIEFKKHQIYVISPISPLGQKLMNVNQGELLEFNAAKYQINKII